MDGYYTQYAPQKALIDDTSKLTAILGKQATNTDRLMVHGTVAVLLKNFADWNPGDSISQIQNRGITFSQKPTLLRVVYDFPAGHVQLALDNQSTQNIVGRKPQDTNAGNPEQHRLRTGNLQEIKGHKGEVPYSNITEEEFRTNMGY